MLVLFDSFDKVTAANDCSKLKLKLKKKKKNHKNVQWTICHV